MKISINLLPVEVLTKQLSKAKYNKVQAIGIIVIMTMVFLSLATIALRIVQNKSIVDISTKVAAAQQQVSSLKNTQATLLLLKNRLQTISLYWGVPSGQTALYQLINELVPSSVVIDSIGIDKSGEVTFLALAPDSNSLEALMENLTSKEASEGKISQISIDSLSRGRDSFFRISFKVQAQNI